MRYGRTNVYYESEGMWQALFMVSCKILPWNWPGGTEENDEKPQ